MFFCYHFRGGWPPVCVCGKKERERESVYASSNSWRSYKGGEMQTDRTESSRQQWVSRDDFELILLQGRRNNKKKNALIANSVLQS